MRGAPIFAAVLLAAPPAAAKDARELCPDRPGLGTPACTVSPGSVVAELGLADWTRESDGAVRSDTVLAGDALVRIGLAEHLEGQIGWTAFGHASTRDRVRGLTERASRTGDVTLALRRNLRNPDGSGLSLAVMPFATLPAGRQPIGAGDWGAGLLVPLDIELSDALTLALTPEINAAVDEDGTGRHLAYGSVAGLELQLSSHLVTNAEVLLLRDEDPDGHATQALAGVSAGWQPNDDMQVDFGVNLALNSRSPDSQVYLGITRRF